MQKSGCLPPENEVCDNGFRPAGRSRETILGRITTGSIRSQIMQSLVPGDCLHDRHLRSQPQFLHPAPNLPGPIFHDRTFNHDGNLPLHQPPVRQLFHRPNRNLNTIHDLSHSLDNPTSRFHNRTIPPGLARLLMVPQPSPHRLRLMNS